MEEPDQNPAAGPVQLTENGSVSVVLLCDAAPGNRLGPVMVRALIEAVARARGGAIVLAATGKNFCTGGDHHALASLSPSELRAYLDDLRCLFPALANQPVPVVAAVQGAAIGGVELVVPVDFVVASRDATFHLPQVAMGIRLGEYSYRALLARCDLSFARRMVLTGDKVSAAEAARHGLVDRVAPAEDLLDSAVALAEQLAGQPGKAMSRARASLAEWSARTIG